MTRPGPSALVPVAVVALAVFAWVASPQGDGVLDRAADALEAAGTVTIRTEVDSGRGGPFVTRFDVDLVRDVAVIDDPEPGVTRRLVTRTDVYDRLPDGTWLLLLDGAPPLFGQDVAAQLRGIEAAVEEVGRRGYRLRYRQLGSDAEAFLEVDGEGMPRRFAAVHDLAGRRTVLTWEVLRSGFVLDVDPPRRARPVGVEERARLVEAGG